MFDLKAFSDELMKIARPEHDFAVTAKQSNTGKPAYPIPDKQHAASALGFAKMHGDTKDYSEVRKDVEKKFPGLIHDKEKEGSMMGGGGAESYGAAKLPTSFQAPPVAGSMKMAGVLSRVGKALASEAGTHKAELAGLGILAAPSIDEAQAHIRAGLSRDKSHDAVEKRTLLHPGMKPASELAGLGVLAGPSLAHLMGKHAGFLESLGVLFSKVAR